MPRPMNNRNWKQKPPPVVNIPVKRKEDFTPEQIAEMERLYGGKMSPKKKVGGSTQK